MAITPEQRLERQNYLGGSDIAAILGMSRYASPLDIYNDKIGELTEDVGNEATNRGNLLEPIIIQMYKENRPSCKVEVEHETFIHPKYPFLRANIDARHNASIVEAKSVHMWSKTAKEFGEEGTDQIPTEYLVQCAFYNEVLTDYEEVMIPVAFVKDNSGTRESIDRFSIYHYTRNEKLGQGIIHHAVRFWEDYVLKRIPPSGESLRAKANPITRSKIITPELDLAYVALLSKMEMMKKLEKEINEYKAKFTDYLDEFESLKDEPGKELATWKDQTSNRFDLKAFEAEHPDLYKKYLKQITSRVFRLKD